MKYTLRSSISLSIPNCQSEKSAIKMGSKAFFYTKANEDLSFVLPNKKRDKKPVSMALSKVSKQGLLKNKDDSATVNSSRWNCEDGYKYYLENSIKKKLRSSGNTYQPQKIHKIHQEKSTLFPPAKTDSPGNFNGTLMNVRVVLKKLPTSVSKSELKPMNSKNNKLRSSTISRTNKDSKSNVKLTKSLLQLMKLQLRTKPVVTLDMTTVKNYIVAKRVMQKILRADKEKYFCAKYF